MISIGRRYGDLFSIGKVLSFSQDPIFVTIIMVGDEWSPKAVEEFPELYPNFGVHVHESYHSDS